MKNLLLKIQTELRGVDGIRDRDVYLSADADIIPESNRFPCIGIKDGPIARHELMGGVISRSLTVSIHVYNKLLAGENEVKAVLDMADDVHAALADNCLADYVRDVSPVSETPVQVLYRRGMDALMLRKTISYEYEQEA